MRKLILTLLIIIAAHLPAHAAFENEFGKINSDHMFVGYVFATATSQIMTPAESLMAITLFGILKEMTDKSGFDAADIASNTIGWGIGMTVVSWEF
jgi:hypothetical protein